MQLNTKQRRISMLCGIAILAMLIYAPFQFIVNGVTFNLGYAFIFEPPRFRDSYSGPQGSIAALTLCVQWLAVLIAGAIALLFAKD